MFPSNFRFNIILCGYCIFNLCISKELESRFLALDYHTLIGTTMEHYIVITDKYNELLFSCDMCETEIIIYNIFIHAYKYIACKMCIVLNMVHIF